MDGITFLKINDIVGSFFDLGGKTLIIFAHGLTGNRLQYPILELSYLFYKSGYSTFRFDFRGRGESFYPQDKYSIRSMVEDLKQILNYFSNKYKRIFLVVKSISSIPTLILKPKVNGVVFLGLPFDIHKNITEEDLISIKSKGYVYYKGLIYGRDLVNEYLDIGPKIKELVVDFDVNSLAIYGEKDNSLDIARSYLPTDYIDLKIIKGVGHSFDEREEALKELYDIILDFIKK